MDRSRRLAGRVLWTAIVLSATVPVVALAAKEREVPRIGFLALDEESCHSEAFTAGLRELGYLEGKNIALECRHGGGRYDGLQPAADALVGRKPAIIVAFGQSGIVAVQRATKDIPVVMLASGEPVESGFAASFSRPGSNLTGLTYYVIELNAKRLELLKSVVPGLRRVAVLVDPKANTGVTRLYLRDTREAARTMGIEIVVVKASSAADLEGAFDEMAKARAQAVLVYPYHAFMVNTQEIATLAKWRELPSIHVFTHYSALGGLMSYGPDFGQLQRRAAVYVDKILKGANPAVLPIEQPVRFEFSINLETARELGLNVPKSLLVRADKIIE